jgi:crossover junction endodeoxyribonuclease RuvC
MVNKNKLIYIGIDPGKSGAIAIAKGSDWTVIRLNQTEHDIAGQLSQAMGFPSIAVVEKVHSSPQMGVKSAFTFGESFGFLKGLLAAYSIPYSLVTPQVWQKRMGCMTKGDKNVTKQAAQRRWPGEKITHADADARLLAEYCRVICG